jgi:hypothetical protein
VLCLNGGLSLTTAPITLCQPWKSTIMFQLASLSQTSELARSPTCANPLPTLVWYKQRNTNFLFQRSQVVSVSKWNALLGKEATHLKEIHFDASDDEDGIATVDVADMTESPGKDLVPIDDHSVGDPVLKQTVGVVKDFVVHELPIDSTEYLEGSALNWLDKNKTRDGSFSLSFLDNESKYDLNFPTIPAGLLPIVYDTLGLGLHGRNFPVHLGQSFLIDGDGSSLVLL